MRDKKFGLNVLSNLFQDPYIREMNYNIFMVPLLRVSHKKGVKIEKNYVILNTML